MHFSVLKHFPLFILVVKECNTRFQDKCSLKNVMDNITQADLFLFFYIL